MDITQTLKSALKRVFSTLLSVTRKAVSEIMNPASLLFRKLASFTRSILPDSFEIIEKYETLKKLFLKGGIRLKWIIIVSTIILIVVFLLSWISITISSTALLNANDRLCRTIAANISSAESVITSEGSTFQRSLILQDYLKGVSNQNIRGLVYAAVYDLRGMLVERRYAYAAHTDGNKRARYYSKELRSEFKNIDSTAKEKIKYPVTVEKDGEKIKEEVWCYRYRIPFNFFDTKVGVIEIVFTEESILGPVERARLIMVLVAIAMLLVGIGIAAYVSTQFVHPVVELTTGVTRVGQGDLTITLKVTTHDEIGVLTGEFNRMIIQLREKLQMEKFVSESTVTMIREKTVNGDVELGGVRKTMAFLFADVRGFTAMSENLPPEEVVGILNDYLDLQAQIIRKHGGDIDKFVGDEVMATFDGSSMADNALEAAVDIVQSIKSLNRAREDEGKRTIQVGVGLNMGEVVHGSMGSRDRMDNTSIGDTVNLAARLCSYADPGMILASREIMMKAGKKKFKGKKMDPIKVKGKAKEIEVYKITGKEK